MKYRHKYPNGPLAFDRPEPDTTMAVDVMMQLHDYATVADVHDNPTRRLRAFAEASYVDMLLGRQR